MESPLTACGAIFEIKSARYASKNPGTALVGCAGWSISHDTTACFSENGSHLQRYSSRFGAVEINSSFYRSHRPSTYARWAASVPDEFRFCVKLPRLISHQLRLSGIEQALATFFGEAGTLGDKLGCILVQLPPSGIYIASVAHNFFTLMRQNFSCMVACEARHPSWYGSDATTMLEAHAITRVQADPPVGQTQDFVPTTKSRYMRLHGSPKVYYSSYSEAYLAGLVDELSREAHPAWLIFDNTASGAAIQNALTVRLGGASPWGLPQPST